MSQLIYIPAVQCGTICVNPKRMTFIFIWRNNWITKWVDQIQIQWKRRIGMPRSAYV